MNLTPLPASSEEQEQILQTIEMFEVIIEASPQDCQSMEILRDAYLRVGRASDAHAISRRLADTYLEQGQFSQAMYEYEAILQRDPTNADVIAALSQLEERLSSEELKAPAELKVPQIAEGNVLKPSMQMLDSATLEVEYQTEATESGTLMVTNQTRGMQAVEAPKLITPEESAAPNEGNAALAKFLIQHRLAPEDVVNSAMERVAKKNAERQAHSLPIALVDEICRRGSVDLETLLCGIVDRSKFAYIPLEYYDVDRAAVRMLPEHLTVGRLMVPFDVMSRTVMVATVNPFDASAKETAQQLLDYHIQWHLASPQAITQVLAAVYKIGAAPDPISFRISA